MASLALLSSLLLAGQALASTLSPRAELIQWQDCPGYDARYKCGKFEVPVNRQNPTGNKMILPVARITATATTKKGTLFYNPGGPGLSGVEAIMGKADYFDKFTGGQYDVVSWDPRGSGNTDPHLTCFDTEEAYEGFMADAKMLTYDTEISGLFNDTNVMQRWLDQEVYWDKMLNVMDVCYKKHGDYLKYIGTADTVHDMVDMANYLETPSNPIHYMGYAYGTVIGLYFVNMYPDRVGYVILDGVVNPVYWSEKQSWQAPAISLTDSDEALQGFALACHLAGKASCPILEDGWTQEDIIDFVDDLFVKPFLLKEKGIDVPYMPSILRFLVYNYLFIPVHWEEFAKHLYAIDKELDSMLDGGAVSVSALLAAVDAYIQTQPKVPPEIEDVGGSFANALIRCSDAADATFTTQDVMEEIIRITEEVTPRFGLNPRVWTDFYCHKLPVRAIERYQGPWNKKLAHPILLIGNEADPLTPYDSAKYVADELGDSAILVERDDYGHAYALSSKCTTDIISQYLSTGTLPSQDQKCSIDQQIFSTGPAGSGTKVTVSQVKAGMLDQKKSASVGGDSGSGGTPPPTESSSSGKNQTLVIALASAGGALLLLLGGGIFFMRRRKSSSGSGRYAKVGAPNREVVDGAEFDIDELADEKGKDKDQQSLLKPKYKDPFTDKHEATESSSLLAGK